MEILLVYERTKLFRLRVYRKDITNYNSSSSICRAFFSLKILPVSKTAGQVLALTLRW